MIEEFYNNQIHINSFSMGMLSEFADKILDSGIDLTCKVILYGDTMKDVNTEINKIMASGVEYIDPDSKETEYKFITIYHKGVKFYIEEFDDYIRNI